MGIFWGWGYGKLGNVSSNDKAQIETNKQNILTIKNDLDDLGDQVHTIQGDINNVKSNYLDKSKAGELIKDWVRIGEESENIRIFNRIIQHWTSDEQLLQELIFHPSGNIISLKFFRSLTGTKETKATIDELFFVNEGDGIRLFANNGIHVEGDNDVASKKYVDSKFSWVQEGADINLNVGNLSFSFNKDVSNFIGKELIVELSDNSGKTREFYISRLHEKMVIGGVWLITDSLNINATLEYSGGSFNIRTNDTNTLFKFTKAKIFRRV